MAHLILTEEERAAASYLDWDDVALGRFTRLCGLELLANREDESGIRRIAAASVAAILIGQAYAANAATLTVILEGHTSRGVDTGDWKITIERIRPPVSELDLAAGAAHAAE